MDMMTYFQIICIHDLNNLLILPAKRKRARFCFCVTSTLKSDDWSLSNGSSNLEEPTSLLNCPLVPVSMDKWMTRGKHRCVCFPVYVHLFHTLVQSPRALWALLYKHSVASMCDFQLPTLLSGVVINSSDLSSHFEFFYVCSCHHGHTHKSSLILICWQSFMGYSASSLIHGKINKSNV